MGREIRKVPKNWEHPKLEFPSRYKPLCDQNFDAVFNEWLEDFDRVRRGELSDTEKECYPLGLQDWITDNPSPDADRYREYKDDEATWFQMYETVSEGTPVSPPFPEKSDIVEYLVRNGDFWDQIRGHGGWTREAAESFVLHEFAVSGIISNGKVFSPRDGAP